MEQLAYIPREYGPQIREFERPVNDGGGDHNTWIEGSVNDSAKWIPTLGVKPIGLGSSFIGRRRLQRLRTALRGVYFSDHEQ
ncbi:hypothetical protein L2E82_15996 [Cichorium intybus]|uniref:Uncharacterized protein n=1 Tax=Cichorium intybus TaxID=13427 RepID=A0ACB9F4C7_CICIN|nr:hypothetical protein L2E82_15996 [Cichorium intybus]